LKALALRRGERVLDIGSGPGLLACDMAASVGRDGRVCGIDISEDMLTMSRRRCADQPWTEFQRADATNLPYPDDSFDAAVSTQVYEYVVDIPVALAELYRVARPDGRVVVMDTDYGSLVIHTENKAPWSGCYRHGTNISYTLDCPARYLGNFATPVSRSDNVT
jgi:ubiquinone/menaquinone biosynthesis C-methylase UbiE